MDEEIEKGQIGVGKSENVEEETLDLKEEEIKESASN